MEENDRLQIKHFEDVLLEKTNFKKVYTLLLRWKVLSVQLEAFKDISAARSDKENNKILYNVIKSRGRHAFSKLKQALQISNPELLDQFEGRAWNISNEQWSCSPQVYHLSKAEIRGAYHIVTFTEDRSGWQKEIDNLKETFELLHFKGSLSKDPTEKELDEALTDFTGSKYDAGCYVFALSGHGHGSQMGESVRLPNKSFKNVNEILSKICKNPSLLNKPKIIILQICRGDNESLESLPYLNTPRTNSAHVPDIKDTIILRPSLPGYVAYRDVELGGWFIDVLTRMIKKYARVMDVEEIMMEVCKEFARMKNTRTGFYEYFSEWRYMTPCTNAYSFKKFYFVPEDELSQQDTMELLNGQTSSTNNEN